MKNSILSFAILFSLFCHNSNAQEPCSALLKNGVYAQLIEITYYNEEYSARTAICDIYHEYKQSKNLVKASGSYATIFKAKGSYSAEEIEKISKIYCGESFTHSELQRTSDIYRSYVDPNLMKTYQACIEANSLGVKLKMSPSNFNTFNQLTVVVSSNTNPKPKIVELLYDQSKLNIIGNLGDASNSEISLESPKSFIAIRKDYNEADLKSEPKRMLASAHNLVITFENGQAAAITFPEIWSKPIKKLEYGIGKIITSALDEKTFKSVYGDDWMPCNGDAVPIGSRYEQFVNAYVPNLNGNKFITDIRTGTIDHNKDINTIAKVSPSENWNWILSLNNITGNKWNNDWEQAEDNFNVSLSDNVANAKGRTFNFKHGQWGGWKAGTANYFGLKTEDGIYYYIKIN